MTRSKQVQTYEGMAEVKLHYVSSGNTDTQFAAYLTLKTGHGYSVAQVRSYRQALDIPNNGAATKVLKCVYLAVNTENAPGRVEGVYATENACDKAFELIPGVCTEKHLIIQ